MAGPAQVVVRRKEVATPQPPVRRNSWSGLNSEVWESRYHPMKLWYEEHGVKDGDKRENDKVIKERALRYKHFPESSRELSAWLKRNPGAWEDFLEDTTNREGFCYDTAWHTRGVLRVILFVPLLLFFISTIFGEINLNDEGYDPAPGVTLNVFGVKIPWYYQSTNPGIAVPALWVQWTECIFRQRSPVQIPANMGSVVMNGLQSCLGRCVAFLCRCCRKQHTVDEDLSVKHKGPKVYETFGILPYGWFMYTATAGTITYNFIRLGWGVPFSLLMGVATYFFYPLLFLSYSRMIVARHSDLTRYQSESIFRGLCAVVICIACLSYAGSSYSTHLGQAYFATRIFGRDIATWYMFYECLITSKAIATDDLHCLQVIALAALLVNFFAICLGIGFLMAKQDMSDMAQSGINAITLCCWMIAGVSSIFGFYLRLWQQQSELREGERWHFFISHFQATGGNQANVLCLELQKRGYLVWYDNKMSSINTDAMKEGVRKSAVFILFLSEGVFTRPYVRLEVMEALDAGKLIVLIHETDQRFGKFCFHDEKCIDEDYRGIVHNFLLKELESIGWERRDYKMAAVLTRLINKFKSRPRSRTASLVDKARAASLSQAV